MAMPSWIACNTCSCSQEYRCCNEFVTIELFSGTWGCHYNYLPTAIALFFICLIYLCPSPADLPRGQMNQIGCRWIARFLI